MVTTAPRHSQLSVHTPITNAITPSPPPPIIPHPPHPTISPTPRTPLHKKPINTEHSPRTTPILTFLTAQHPQTPSTTCAGGVPPTSTPHGPVPPVFSLPPPPPRKRLRSVLTSGLVGQVVLVWNVRVPALFGVLLAWAWVLAGGYGGGGASRKRSHPPEFTNGFDGSSSNTVPPPSRCRQGLEVVEVVKAPLFRG
ncbi:hypothetical protein VNI00_019071 [Paramarasmius palmivorus]|uniref:Uncharacterized protein n=1 Tax=Paramarasmius palmivorus TaxID=297713 RepID=A0AAW0AQD7_9AGAR